MTGSGRRRIDAFTVTGICARTPSASTAATRPRSARTGGAIPRARSRSSPMAAPASSRARRTNSAISGWPSRRSSARPSCMLRATRRACAPSCRSRSIRRSSAAWTSRAPARVRVSSSTRASSSRSCGRRLGSATTTIAWAPSASAQRGHRPQRPERAAAGERVDREEHGRDPARSGGMQRQRPLAIVARRAGPGGSRAGSSAARRGRTAPTSARSSRRRSAPR